MTDDLSRRWLTVLAAGLLHTTGPAFAADGSDNVQPSPSQVEVFRSAPVTPYRFDINVRDLPAPQRWRPGDPIREIPRRAYFHPARQRNDRIAANQGLDPLLRFQQSTPEALRVFVAPDRNFDGQGFSGVNPPDTVGDVGPNHYVQMINDSGGATVRIYDKATPTPNILADFELDTLGGGPCAFGLGDPIVLYDRFADRWLLSEFSSSGNRLCVYISQTADPTGTYFNYDLTAPNFPDYPKYGIWPTDANGGSGSYIVTTNEAGLGVYAIDRAALLAAAAVTFQRFSIPDLPGFAFNAVTPADLDGPNPPPAGTPAVIMRHRDTEAHAGPVAPGDVLEMWHYDVDWAVPANTTLTQLADVDVAEFESDLCGLSAFACFPQPGTGTTLDPLREVIMNRLQYLNLNEYEALLGNFVTDVDGTDHGGLRWFELRRVGGAAAPWTLHQEGTFSPDADNRWMAASAMDQSGNIAIGYNVSSATTFPGLRYTGRLANDPLSTMTQGENTIVAGSASNSSNRYGDYSGMNLDPADDCTFWFTGEYNASGNWSTRVASFRFDACGCDLFPLPPTISGGVAGPNQVDLAWDDSELAGVVEYRVMRSRTSGGPYTRIATVADTSPGIGSSGSYVYSDTTVSGGIDYHYVVRASDGGACTSGPSNELSVTATGVCTLPPLFNGLESVATANIGICTLDLTWSAATPECAGPASYEIYRSTLPAFTPDPDSNRIATTASTAYADADLLTDGLEYFYIVRAVDDSNSVAETNLMQRSGIPRGVPVPPIFYDDGGDTGVAQLTASGPWSVQPTGGNSGPGVYTTGDYGDFTCADLVTPSIALGGANRLTFWSTYDIEAGWDKGEVQISNDGGGSWTRLEVGYPANSVRTSDQCGLPEGDYFTGTAPGWARFEADLSPWDGQTVMLRWLMSSDTTVRGTGWLIDDIEVGFPPGTCATASACADNPIVDVTPDGPLTACPLSIPQLTAELSGGVGPFTYQWYQDGMPIAGATDPTFQPVDGGTHTYNARVKAATCPDQALDGQPTEIVVESSPQFAGVVSATDRNQITCAIDVDWDAAWSVCPGPIVYDVYRATSPGVAPVPANRVGTGVLATSYADTIGLDSGVEYHYLVRAVETSTGQEDANTAERSALPTAPGEVLAFSDDAGDSGSAQLSTTPPWSVQATGGNAGPNVYATGEYGNNLCVDLTTPVIGGVATTLSFWSRAGIEQGWDKGEVQFSTDGGSTWSRVEVAYPGTSTDTNDTDACDLGSGDFFTGLGGAGWTQYTADLSGRPGESARVRWQLSTDGSINEVGWWVDDIEVHVAADCQPGVAGPPPAPDGSFGTDPLRAENLADGIADTLGLTWDASCGATDYNLIYGDLVDVASYVLTGSRCGLGTGGTYTWTGVPSGDLYFLIVGTDGAGEESSWGAALGGERNGLVDSGECGVATKNPTVGCP